MSRRRCALAPEAALAPAGTSACARQREVSRRRCALAPWAAALASLLGCTQQNTAAPLRSLQSSGPLAFLCLSAPSGDAADFARPLADCSAARTSEPYDYEVPHLYALVTQPIQGEVAVVDLTTEDQPVIDQDPSVPGASFLPVGAEPTDIVATPGGMASFVTVAEPSFEGIYALPSTMVRGSAPRLSSWPSCSLPAAPGTMLLAVDPPDANGLLRPSCDAVHGDEDTSSCVADGTGHCHGELGREAGTTGKTGRYKLIVALPSRGGFAVIDAQNVLDRDAGSWQPCSIERWIPLETNLVTPPTPPLPTPNGCVNEHLPGGPVAQAFVPQPGDMALGDRRLYIGDGAAPMIHVVDLPTPCEPVERPGLFPRSVEDPTRVVLTGRLALSPKTLDLRRYLHAIDVYDGSVMTFDVSDDSTSNTPLSRGAPGLNPFQPADRIRFQVPPRALVSLEHLNDSPDGTTGASLPVRCDPDPNSTGPGTAYRTSSAYDSGAGPSHLRGVFSFVVLASGDVVTIDVDDYDAPCRGPRERHPLYGCSDSQKDLVTAGDYSCRTVEPQQPRAAGYLVEIADVASNVPGIQDFPVLFDSSGTVVNLDAETAAGKAAPRMRATIPVDPPPSFSLVVGSGWRNLDPTTGELLTSTGAPEPSEHTVAMNMEEPRAHILSQAWTVTFEGGLVGFDGRYGELVPGSDDVSFRLRDPSSRFCGNGVLGQQAEHEILLSEGTDPSAAQSQAVGLADYVQIISATPVETDAYWTDQSECSFSACKGEYGTADQPRVTRDLRIVEAWEDELQLELRNASSQNPTARLKCCFPGVVAFHVRVGGQWVALGDKVGVMHHVVADPLTGTCRQSCDPAQARRNSRGREVPQGTVLLDGDANAFINPFLRFFITRGVACDDQNHCHDLATARDTQFQLVTLGAFSPLTVSVVQGDIDLQPQSVEYLTPTGELVVSDGSLQGITLVDLSSMVVTRQYY